MQYNRISTAAVALAAATLAGCATSQRATTVESGGDVVPSTTVVDNRTIPTGVQLMTTLDQSLGTREHLHLGVLGRARGGVRIRERNTAHSVLPRLLAQQLPARIRGEACHLELGIALDHVKRLGPDRAGGPDYENPAHSAESREGFQPLPAQA